jgi:hypothetical protein
VSTPLVNYRSYGNPEHPTLFILHGIFGMLDNWHYAAVSFQSSTMWLALMPGTTVKASMILR